MGAGYMVLLRGRIFGGHVCAQPVLLSGLCGKADSKLIVLSLSGRGEIVDSTSMASTICEYNFGERMDSWGFL